MKSPWSSNPGIRNIYPTPAKRFYQYITSSTSTSSTATPTNYSSFSIAHSSTTGSAHQLLGLPRIAKLMYRLRTSNPRHPQDVMRDSTVHSVQMVHSRFEQLPCFPCRRRTCGRVDGCRSPAAPLQYPEHTQGDSSAARRPCLSLLHPEAMNRDGSNNIEMDALLTRLHPQQWIDPFAMSWVRETSIAIVATCDLIKYFFELTY